MSINSRKIHNALLCLLLAALLVSEAGCSSAKAKAMPAMLHKNDIKVTRYKIAVAESLTLDKIVELTSRTKYDHYYDLSFKSPGHLKAVYTEQDKQVKEGEILAEIDTSDLENQLARRRIDLEKTKLRYEELLLNGDVGYSGGKFGLESIKCDIEAINLDVERLTKEIGESRLVAPISGIVSYVAKYELGNTVEAFKSFITVSATDSLIFATEVINPVKGPFKSDYCDPSGIVEGISATLEYGSGDKKAVIPAKVVRVISEDPGSVPAAPDAVGANGCPPFHLLLKAIGPLPKNVKADANAVVKINTGKLENAVVIPKSALDGFGEDTIVRVMKNGKIIKRRVVTGYENNDSKIIEVTSGVRPGENLIVN